LTKGEKAASVTKMIVLFQEIELVFKPHPKDHDPETVAQQTRYIKTTANASGKSTCIWGSNDFTSLHC